MGWGVGCAGRACRLLGLLLCLSGALQPAETLQVLMGSTPLIVSLNDNISIPCKISGFNTAELDIKNVGVTWYLKTPRADQEEKVFTFHAGAHISHRNGASMSDSDLRRGNAALSLPQIQFKEAGIYRCYVIVAPSDAHGTAILEVVAQPEVSLSPKEVTIESDKEKTLSCDVNKFYPNLVDIKWMKISKNNQDSSVAAEDIHTGASVENEDGTFNVTSKLRLQPSLQDNGNVYRCIVSHKTFPAKLLLNSTLTVTAPKSALNSIIGAVIGTIIACIIVLGLGTFVYCRCLKKNVHELDEAERSLEVTHKALQQCPAVQSRTLKAIAVPVLDPVLCSTHVPRPDEHLTLTCTIHSFFPETTDAVWYKDERVPEKPFISDATKGLEGLFFAPVH